MLISLLFFLVIILYLLPPSKVNFFDIYTKNDKASESLKEFQSRKTKLLNINGVEWKYYRGGNGDKTILFLHGMGGSYDIWWQQINAFEKEYQVLSYTLPKEITTLEQVANGIKEITKIENIDTFYAVGTSMGGYITQYLIQQIPNRLEKVVLSNTFPPNNLIQTENKKKAKIVPYLP
jgi:pimeloyl-ACP methyl ester carboxylesterase